MLGTVALKGMIAKMKITPRPRFIRADFPSVCCPQSAGELSEEAGSPSLDKRSRLWPKLCPPCPSQCPSHDCLAGTSGKCYTFAVKVVVHLTPEEEAKA